MVDEMQAARVGITLGNALAVTISWTANRSILWAIIHGILSWLYVIYYAIVHHQWGGKGTKAP